MSFCVVQKIGYTRQGRRFFGENLSLTFPVIQRCGSGSKSRSAGSGPFQVEAEAEAVKFSLPGTIYCL